ncbi:hypothetical protein D3C87_1236960 [compost metagenome]
MGHRDQLVASQHGADLCLVFTSHVFAQLGEVVPVLITFQDVGSRLDNLVSAFSVEDGPQQPHVVFKECVAQVLDVVDEVFDFQLRTVTQVDSQSLVGQLGEVFVQQVVQAHRDFVIFQVIPQELANANQCGFLGQLDHHTDHRRIDLHRLHVTVVVLAYFSFKVLGPQPDDFIQVFDFSFFERMRSDLIRNDLHFGILHGMFLSVEFVHDCLRFRQFLYFLPINRHCALGWVQDVRLTTFDFVLEVFHLLSFRLGDFFDHFFYQERAVCQLATNMELHVGVRVEGQWPWIFQSPGTFPARAVSRTDLCTVIQYHTVVRTLRINRIHVGHGFLVLAFHVRFRLDLCSRLCSSSGLLLTYRFCKRLLLLVGGFHRWSPHVIEHRFDNGCTTTSGLRSGRSRIGFRPVVAATVTRIGECVGGRGQRF